MAFFGVTQFWVPCDDNVSITDFFQGTEAKGVDIDLSHDHAATTTTKKERKKKSFLRMFLCARFVKRRGVFTGIIPLCSSSNDLQILEWAE